MDGPAAVHRLTFEVVGEERDEHGPAGRVPLHPEQSRARRLVAAVPRPGTRVDAAGEGGDEDEDAVVT